MKIATWNIGGGYISQNQNLVFETEDISYFADELKNIQPDVVCLQEAHISESTNQPQTIADALDFKYVLVHPISDSHLKDGERLSVAIISKYSIISSIFYLLPNPNLQFIWKSQIVNSHDKGFLESIIDYNGDIVRVLSGHMAPFRKLKRNILDKEFKNIREEVEKIILIKQMPQIICADMNYNDGIGKVLPNVFKEKFKSVLPDTPTTSKGRKYDKIITSKEWQLTNADIIKGKADHYLCTAEFNCKK